MYYAKCLVFRSLLSCFIFLGFFFSSSSSISECNPISTNVPTPVNFERIKFYPKPYIDKSLSLVKFTIIMCASILDMKDCNGEVLT